MRLNYKIVQLKERDILHSHSLLKFRATQLTKISGDMTVVSGDIMGTSGEMTFGRLDRLPTIQHP